MTTQMKGDENKISKESIIPQSYKGMTLEEARLFLRSVMDLFQSLASMTDLKTMYEAGKQLSRLYFDCANHQRELAEILLELEFPEYAIRTMKKLNNMGVFKNDDIWFSSFYFYNICWNYSDASFEFATALGLSGLPNLLNLNIGHKPYLDNLSSRNVYYLIKASLSIIHNICRYAGSCVHFRSEGVKSALLNLVDREEDFIRVVASLCLASIVGEDEDQLMVRGDEDVMASIIGYVRKARTSDRSRFMGFRSHELLQGLRSATAVESERRHLVALDGLAVVREGLQVGATATDEDVAECLEIVSNLSANEGLRATLAEAGLGPEVIRPLAGHEHPRVRTAAQDCLWALDMTPSAAVADQTDQEWEPGAPVPIYLSHAAINRSTVLKIQDRLAESGLVSIVDPDDRSSVDSVKRCIRRSAVVIVCVSEALKSQRRHQLEVDYSQSLARPIVPLLIQQKYRPDGWLHRLLDRDDVTMVDLSSKRDFETAWDTFMSNLGERLKVIRSEYQQRQRESRRVKQEKQSHEEEEQRQRSMERSSNCVDDSTVCRSGQQEPTTTQIDSGSSSYRRFNGPENNANDESRSRAPGTDHRIVITDATKNSSNNSNIAWLDRHGLGHLRTQLAWFDMSLLKYYKDVKVQAPEYFYQTLERQLKLDFVDILKFSNAINYL